MTDPLKQNPIKDYRAAVHILDKLTEPVPEDSKPQTYWNAVSLSKRLGMTHDRLDKLSIIHVGGSKGKGSVCAMSENILRESGFKTGFLSSPHLVEFRERIRIDGKPLSKELFAKYFFDLYNQLERTDDGSGIENGLEGTTSAIKGTENREGTTKGVEGTENDKVKGKEKGKEEEKVSAFHFLTMMGYHVFIEEKVDVAIIEVGLGGTYDSTNIHRCPTVVAISLLDYDHMSILGNTINAIAGVKAGICKPGRPAFTIEQPEDGLVALKLGAKAQNASSIQLCPSLKSYDFKGHPIQIGIAGDHQNVNASLAFQLCKTWMKEMDKRMDFQLLPTKSNQPESDLKINRDEMNTTVSMAHPFVLPDSFIKGLKNCYWPGRTQVVKQDCVTYYVDCAHTKSSVKACLQWFEGAAKTEAEAIDGTLARILVFNVKGDRDYAALLKPFMTYHFDGVVFCPSVESLNNVQRSDNWGYLTHNYDDQIDKCRKMESTFNTSLLDRRGNTLQHHTDPEVMVLPCVQEALQWIARRKETADHTQVLVTGSLYLVGTVISILDPELAFE